ncbi:MAG: hypothetical protein KC543_15090 [Myxococcales bacterium]|nr:hypothetical protein [Myxococcales bacterium]
MGLPRSAARSDAAQAVWASEPAAVATLCDAADRVRRFAYPDAALAAIEPAPDGRLRFELQGQPYVVQPRAQVVDRPAALAAEAPGWLAAALDGARAGAGDARPVGAVIAAAHLPASGGEAPAAFVEAAKGLGCIGVAWSFPALPGRAEYAFADARWPGALLLLAA